MTVNWLTESGACRIYRGHVVEIQPLQVEIEREEDGRHLASVPELPGVMAYVHTQELTLRKASTWSSMKAKRVYAALTRSGWTLKKQVGSHRKLQKPG